MLVKDRKIILAKFNNLVYKTGPHPIRIPTKWFDDGYNFWRHSTDYLLKTDELVIAMPHPYQDYYTKAISTRYRVLPFRPYIEGIIPTNAIYYDEVKIGSYPTFRENMINLEI